MKTLKKISVQEFENKYKGRTHISCGIHYVDGDLSSIQNVSYPYLLYILKTSSKEVAYIAIF